MATRSVPRARVMPEQQDVPKGEDAAPEATGLPEAQGNPPNTQQPEEEKQEERKLRGIRTISTELEQEASAVNSLELQIRSHRNRIIELSEELNEALAPSLRAVGIQTRITHAGTGLPVIPITTRRPRSVTTDGKRTPEEADQARIWARENNWANPATGKAIAEKGPIPKALWEAFDKAQAA